MFKIHGAVISSMFKPIEDEIGRASEICYDGFKQLAGPSNETNVNILRNRR